MWFIYEKPQVDYLLVTLRSKRAKIQTAIWPTATSSLHCCSLQYSYSEDTLWQKCMINVYTHSFMTLKLSSGETTEGSVIWKHRNIQGTHCFCSCSIKLANYMQWEKEQITHFCNFQIFLNAKWKYDKEKKTRKKRIEIEFLSESNKISLSFSLSLRRSILCCKGQSFTPQKRTLVLWEDSHSCKATFYWNPKSGYDSALKLAL